MTWIHLSINIAKEWLKASSLDLENISYIIKVEHLTSVVAFHLQQDIEFEINDNMLQFELNFFI